MLTPADLFLLWVSTPIPLASNVLVKRWHSYCNGSPCQQLARVNQVVFQKSEGLSSVAPNIPKVVPCELPEKRHISIAFQRIENFVEMCAKLVMYNMVDQLGGAWGRSTSR